MVHALQEAWRVLEPDGLLIDLRPAMVHRRIDLSSAGRCRHIGVTRETFDNETAADQAVAEVVRRGLFRTEQRERFNCTRKMDTLAEFRAWLDEFVRMERLPSHAWLFTRAEGAVRGVRGRLRIVISAPLDLRVLKKCSPFCS